MYVGDRAVVIHSDILGEYVSCSLSCHTVALRSFEEHDGSEDGSWAG
jgi:hypothetical protein